MRLAQLGWLFTAILQVGFTVPFVTTASQLFVQPVAVFVTVTVYEPAARPLMLDVVAALLHKYVTLVAFVLTLAAPFGVVQFVFGVGVHTAVGRLVVLATTATHVFVHPVVVFVTVTV